MVRPVSRWSAVYKQLKNRRVIRMGVVYLAFFWGAVEVADLLAGANIISEDLVRWLLAGGVLSFPAVLGLSWFFESPWRERRWFSVLGDVGVIVAITVATLLLVREQLVTSFTRPVVAIMHIEPTDTRVDTIDLAGHLSRRFRMLLATSDEIRVMELDSSQSPAISGLPLPMKASALGADFLIGGTVNQGNGEVRLNMQLFNAEGELLWTEHFSDRLIDQAQLQNRVLNEIWPHLPLSRQARETSRGLVVNCEYPANPEAIHMITSAGRSEYEARLEALSSLIAQNQDNGLLHLARARAYFGALDTAPVVIKPILQNLAMQDLDQAAMFCPGHPDIGLLRLYHTRQLKLQPHQQSQFLARFPNESQLRLQLAFAYAEKGDMETSTQLAEEAWTLNPLDSRTVCDYRQLLGKSEPGVEVRNLKTVEESMRATSFTLERMCP